MQGISSDYFRMTIKRETLFILLIIVFLLGYDTILIEPYQLVAFLTKILIVAGFFLFFRLNKISGNAVTIIFLFSMLLFYGLFIAILNNNFTLSLGLTLKFAWRIFAFTSLLMILQANIFSENIIKIPIWIGVVLSIQSICLFVLIVFGLAPEPSYISCRGLMRSYGILGFLPSLNWGHNNLFIPRLSSFFSEASNFGRFLEYAIVVSFGYFKIFGKKRYLLASLICMSAFLLTFSMTGFFALFLGLSFYALLRTKRFIIKFTIPVLCVLFIISMHLILKGTYVNNAADRTPLQHMLFSKYGDAMRSTDNDIRGLYGGRVYSAIESVKIFIANPFGLGLLQNKDLPIQSMHGDELYTDVHVYGAFLFWLVKTGFVGILIYIFIFFIILRRMKTFWHDKKDIRNFISMAFMSISVHQMVGGDWFDAMFLLCIAIILVFDPKGKSAFLKNNFIMRIA